MTIRSDKERDIGQKCFFNGKYYKGSEELSKCQAERDDYFNQLKSTI